MTHMKKTLGAIAAFALAITLNGTTQAQAAEPAQDTLAAGFAQPPHQAKPGFYWLWLNGNVSKAGLTLDLEAFARLGMGYGQKLDHSWSTPPGPVTFNSPEYWELTRHLLKECERLGIEFYQHYAIGQSPSAGPWVSKENGMHVMAFQTIETQGPQTFTGRIGQAADQIAVVAFPTPQGAKETLWSKSPKVTVTNMPDWDPAFLHDQKSGDGSKAVTLDKDHSLLIELDRDATFRSARMNAQGIRKLILETSQDGKEFRQVAFLMPKQFGSPRWFTCDTMSFPPVTARFFRLRAEGQSTQLRAFEMNNAETVHDLVSRALWMVQYELTPESATEGRRKGLDPATFIDLSGKIDGQGNLTWDVPEGSWTILHFSYTTDGMGYIDSVWDGVQGRQCDKLSAAAVTEHFEGGTLPFVKLAREIGVKSFAGAYSDSWECGQLNWTPGFEKEFQKRRGYDLKPFLPALAGLVVVDRDTTERFLWDFRRTIGDLIVDNHFKLQTELCHKHGVKTQFQTQGGTGSPYDEMRVIGYIDIPQTEIWGGANGSFGEPIRGVPGASHVLGRNIISSETFTCADGSWDTDPSMMKRGTDGVLATGVNRMFIQSSHNPMKDPVGGFAGCPFNLQRGNTWFAHSGEWIKYISRCQFLLQQGRFAASLVYIYGEDTPMRLNPRMPEIPYGYQWDPCPADYAIETMTVKNGKIAFPSGMRYDVLLLPPDERLTPELLRKVKEVVQAGATVLGRKPIGSPTLTDYPAGDGEVRKLADELWPESSEPGVVRQVGKGRMINAWNPEQIRQIQQSFKLFDNSPAMDAYLPKIFAQLGLEPEFTFTSVPEGKGPTLFGHTDYRGYIVNVQFLHRLLDDGGELFFLANNTDMPLTIDADFKVGGLQPQLWYPDTGRRVAVPDYKGESGRTRLRLDFDQAGSVFVVFRKPGVGVEPEPFRAWTVAKTLDVIGPWEVSFQENRGAPPKATFEKLISWPTHEEFGIKYFSGTATYRKTVTVDAAAVKEPGQRWRLDLGDVKNLAGVKVNGVEFGTLWKPPFVVDISSAIKPGENAIEIAVTNVLWNRLVGDEQLPDDMGERFDNCFGGRFLKAWPEWHLKGEPRPTKRVSDLTIWPKAATKDAKLKPAGLLGPVKIEALK